MGEQLTFQVDGDKLEIQNPSGDNKPNPTQSKKPNDTTTNKTTTTKTNIQTNQSPNKNATQTIATTTKVINKPTQDSQKSPTTAQKKKQPYIPKIRRPSELTVITKVKDMINYIFTVTAKSPAKFKFSLVNRLHNICLDIISNLFQANGIYVIGENRQQALEKRLTFQSQAMLELSLLDYIAQLSCEQACILLKQYSVIAKHIANNKNLLGAWINSDHKRFAQPQ